MGGRNGQGAITLVPVMHSSALAFQLRGPARRISIFARRCCGCCAGTLNFQGECSLKGVSRSRFRPSRPPSLSRNGGSCLLLRIVLQDARSKVMKVYPLLKLKVLVDDITSFFGGAKQGFAVQITPHRTHACAHVSRCVPHFAQFIQCACIGSRYLSDPVCFSKVIPSATMSLLGVPEFSAFPPVFTLSTATPTPPTGIRLNPCATQLWGGPSGHLADPTPSTVSRYCGEGAEVVKEGGRREDVEAVDHGRRKTTEKQSGGVMQQSGGRQSVSVRS